MESVLLAAAMMAASTNAAPGNDPVAGAVLDQRCFRLMADLAEDRDPRVQGLGRMAAQYFLGRIDAAEPGFEEVRLRERERGRRSSGRSAAGLSGGAL